jgi:hypothetical protein
MWRRVAAAVAIACVMGGLAAAVAPAQQPDPQELWRAYPLDPSPKTSGATATQQPAVPKERSPAVQPAATKASPLQEGTSSGPSWLVLFAAAAGGAAFVAIILAVYDRLAARRRARRSASAVDMELHALPEDLPWPPRWPAGERVPERPDGEPATVAREPERATYRPGTRATFDLPTQASFEAPGRPRPARPPVDPVPRTAASRNGPVCQVRWSRRGARFIAVTTDADGVEKRIARSPQFEWSELSPPSEDSRAAQAALRQLAKELRDKGWRPLRAKGFDLDERQWYARRFRWPTEAERAKADRTPPVTDARRPASRSRAV